MLKTKRDRRDVIRQVREITGLDENSINQTIEACKDGTGRYSLEQVISLLFDDSNVCFRKDSFFFYCFQYSSFEIIFNDQRIILLNNPSNLPVNHPQAAGSTNNDTITDDVIELSPEIDNQPPADDELERLERRQKNIHNNN